LGAIQTNRAVGKAAKSHPCHILTFDSAENPPVLKNHQKTVKCSQVEKGDPANVSHAVSQMNRATNAKRQRLKRQLASEQA
jgi:hypothetical protein